VLAVKRSSLAGVYKEPAQFRDKRLLEVNDLTATYLGLFQAKSAERPESEVVLRKNEDGTWRFLKPAYGLADFEGKAASPKQSKLAAVPPKTRAGVKGLLGDIGSLQVASDNDFVPLSDSPMSFYGLEDGKEAIRIQVGTGSTEKKDEKAKDKESPKEALLIGQHIKGKDQYYARLAGDRGVVKLDGKALKPVLDALKDPGKLRSRDLLPLDTKNVDAIDIKQGKDLKEVLRFRHQLLKPWQLYAGQESFKADDHIVQQLIDALQGKEAIEEFFDVDDSLAKKKDAELGLDQPVAQVVLYKDAVEKAADKKDDKDAKLDKKKDKSDKGKDDKGKGKKEEKELALKKDAKPAVTLYFGNTVKERVYVKRVTPDETVSRMAVPKSILDKVLPAEGTLAFLDTGLPSFDIDLVRELEIDKNKEKYVVLKGTGEQASRWLLKDRKDYAGKNFANSAQVIETLQRLSSLRAHKWVKKVGEKDDLDKFGLKTPGLSVTVTLAKLTPAASASFVGLLGSATPLGLTQASVGLAANLSAGPGDKRVYTFGKETKEKDTELVYGRYSGKDLVFQVPSFVTKAIREADLRDRFWLTHNQPLLNASLVGMLASPAALSPAWALSPLTTCQVLRFDPDKVKEIKLALRSPVELRSFVFQRNPKEKTWEDKSGLQEFNLDSDKVKEMLDWLAKLQAKRFVFLSGGARAEQKLTAKEASLKIDLIGNDGKVLTVTVGAAEGPDFMAHTSAWPEIVFSLPGDKVEPLLEGIRHFGKARVVRGQ
jgi:hypothetical protein